MQTQWRVCGTKKGGLPVVVEKRPKGKSVTVISNVERPHLLAGKAAAHFGHWRQRSGDLKVQNYRATMRIVCENGSAQAHRLRPLWMSVPRSAYYMEVSPHTEPVCSARG